MQLSLYAMKSVGVWGGQSLLNLIWLHHKNNIDMGCWDWAAMLGCYVGGEVQIANQPNLPCEFIAWNETKQDGSGVAKTENSNSLPVTVFLAKGSYLPQLNNVPYPCFTACPCQSSPLCSLGFWLFIVSVLVDDALSIDCHFCDGEGGVCVSEDVPSSASIHKGGRVGATWPTITTTPPPSHMLHYKYLALLVVLNLRCHFLWK